MKPNRLFMPLNELPITVNHFISEEPTLLR